MSGLVEPKAFPEILLAQINYQIIRWSNHSIQALLQTLSRLDRQKNRNGTVYEKGSANVD